MKKTRHPSMMDRGDVDEEKQQEIAEAEEARKKKYVADFGLL
jgi:hypothetical protein